MQLTLLLISCFLQWMNGTVDSDDAIPVHSGFIDECAAVTGYNFAVYAGGSCYVSMKTMYAATTFYQVFLKQQECLSPN